MRRQRTSRRQVFVLAIGVCTAGLMAGRSGLGQQNPPEQAPQQQQPPPLPENAGAPPQDEAVTSLDSGPIHEAFAEPITLNAEADIVIQQEPPEPVPELPPETRPEGDNVVWIPGYWSWSAEDEDFIWVSGTWRDVPPNQQWVPGYWSEVEGGYRWVHGFWTSTQAEELTYLPPPPESLETRPTSPQPGPDYFWVPGCWRWHDGQYAWRAGFWHPAQQNWIWVPAHYHYTPRGYVYLAGYWDYPLVRRGLLFAPVRFGRPIYRQAGFYFTPRSWIDVTLLTAGLFVSPRRGHYFYGNFYGPQFVSRGYFPWYDYHSRRFGYDPLFSHTLWRHGGRDSRWFVDLRDDYRRFAERGPGPGDRDRFRDDRDRDRGPDRDRARFVKDLSRLDTERVARIDENARREAVERARNRFGDFRRQRADVEARGRPDFPNRDRVSRDERPRERDFDRSGRGDRPDRDFDRPDRGFRDERPDPGDRPDRGRPDRSDRPRFDQPRAVEPRTRQPDARQPRTERPQGDRGQPDRDRRAIEQRVRRPASPPNGSFQLPQRQQRSVPNRGASGREIAPQTRGRTIPPQGSRGPGNFDRGRGQGPGARQVPQNRAAQHRGGEPSFRGRSGGPPSGNRGPSAGNRGSGGRPQGNRGPSAGNRGGGGRPQGNRDRGGRGR